MMKLLPTEQPHPAHPALDTYDSCLLYTSDAADE